LTELKFGEREYSGHGKRLAAKSPSQFLAGFFVNYYLHTQLAWAIEKMLMWIFPIAVFVVTYPHKER